MRMEHISMGFRPLENDWKLYIGLKLLVDNPSNLLKGEKVGHTPHYTPKYKGVDLARIVAKYTGFEYTGLP